MFPINSVFRAISERDESEGLNREPLFNGFVRLLAIDSDGVAYLIRLDVPINQIGVPFKVPLRNLVVEVDAKWMPAGSWQIRCLKRICRVQWGMFRVNTEQKLRGERKYWQMRL